MNPRLRGILMHRALEFLTPSGTPRADAESAADIGAHALKMRLSEQEREDIVSSLAWYAALPEAVAWAEKGSPEHSLLDEENALQRVDRLVDEGERITVLEYKSGRPAAAHIAQLEKYLALLAPACGKEASGVLIYLDLHERRSVGPVAPGLSRTSGDGA